MTEKGDVGIRVNAIFNLVSERLYSTAGAFLRENVQNSIDALRLLRIDSREPIPHSRVEVRVRPGRIEIEDWGVGMSAADIKEYYLTIGSSSKNTPEAQACGVIGKFGIGAFANFGVCHTLEVQSWRKDHPKARVRLSKEQLISGNISYTITNDAPINHLGTTIIGETNLELDSIKLEKLIQVHVQYISEEIIFNGNLISTKSLPYSPSSGADTKDSIELPFGPTRVAVRLLLINGDPAFDITSLDKTGKAEGLLRPRAGNLHVFLNRFMIDANFSMPWRKTIDFEGFIDTDFLQPNAAREGMEYNSSEVLIEFLEKLSRFAIESMARADLLFQQTALIRFVADYSQEHMPLFRVRQYGKRTLIKIGDILEAHKRSGIRVVINKKDEVPPHIASLTQSIILVQLDNVGPDVQRPIIRFLKEKTDATLLSEFEVKALPLPESEVSSGMKSLRLAIQRVLSTQYSLEEFEITLCKADAKSHNIVLQEISGKPVFMVNVESETFKILLEHVGSNIIETLIVRFLIAPHLGDILVKFLPNDLAAAIARFNPKPFAIRLQRVGTIELRKGIGWDGPNEDCIKIISTEFKSLEGYYIKLPDRLGEVLRRYIASCGPPMFIWFGNKVISLLQAGEAKLISLEVRSEELIVGNGNIQGTVREQRGCLIFRTGVFLPIPFPHLRDLLPVERQKEISFGFETHGFSMD